jgi:branched-chain amino acid transport system substrate-binding protein
MKAKLTIAALMCGTMIAGSGGVSHAQDDKLTIGFAVAFSGWMEAYDSEATKMAQLWIEQTNAKGGLLGQQIEVKTADTKTDRVEGAKAGNAMIQEGADLLIYSADYDYGAPAALQAQKAGVVSVSLGAADPKAGILGVGPLSFSATTAGTLEGATSGEWGYAKKGLRKGYQLIDEAIEYNKSLCLGYEWAFTNAGGEVVGKDVFKNADATISSQVTRLANAVRDQGADHLMLCSTTPGAASAIRQIRAAGIDIPILNGTSMDGTYWISAVPDLKDFYVPVQALTVDDPRAEVNKLTAAYAAKYGAAPTTQYAYPIYAWLQLWAKAVETAGTTEGSAVVDVMNTYTDAPTIFGPRTFTDKVHIQTQIPLTITSYQDGKQTAVEEWRISAPIPDAVLYRLKAE